MIPNTGMKDTDFFEAIDKAEKRRYSTKDFKLIGEDRIGGTVDGIESIKQAVYFILNTERYRSATMSDDTGVELVNLIGENPDLAGIKLKSTITDALLNDDRIETVNDIIIRQVSRNVYDISIDISTSLGDIALIERVEV